jgi:hypothetical protein
LTENPSQKFRFWLEWNGSKIGFTEVTGLEVETEIIEYRHGKSPEDSKLQLAGLRKFAKITMSNDRIHRLAT